MDWLWAFLLIVWMSYGFVPQVVLERSFWYRSRFVVGFALVSVEAIIQLLVLATRTPAPLQGIET